MSPRVRHLSVAVTLFAVLAGIVARFAGLGSPPFAVDEYYFAQSVRNILRSGLPEYACGGFYLRGVGLQYLSAGLQLAGVGPELAPRLLAAISNLIALPAVYLIGRRAHSSLTAVLAVGLLALSVWEIELARFGRFYAPFQAVFAWYLVYFLQYTLDGKRRAAWGMVALSTISLFVWEGGLFLLALNLLPPVINHNRGRLSKEQWVYVCLMAVLATAGYALYYLTSDARFAGDQAALPPDVLSAISDSPTSTSIALILPWTMVRDQPLWLAAWVPLAAFAVGAIRWTVSFGQRWLAVIGLLMALIAALLGQFLVCVAALGLLLLTRLIDWREFTAPGARFFLATAVGAALIWLGYGAPPGVAHSVSPDWLPVWLPGPMYRLFSLPAVIEMVALPWGRAIPWVGLSVFLSLAICSARVVASESRVPSALQVVLIVCVVMLLAVGATDAPRIETRYAFFLYPLCLIFVIAAILDLTAVIRQSATLSLVGPAAVLAWFGLTEDFQPRHLLHINSPEIVFREGVSPDIQSHYIVRHDISGVAGWLKQNAARDSDLVISAGIAALDYYYPDLGLMYLEPGDQRLVAWSCQRGTIDRWSNRPLVYRVDELRREMRRSSRAFLVMTPWAADHFLRVLADMNPEVVWVNPLGGETIVRVDNTDIQRGN